MSKHTPGPWRVQFLGNYDADLIHKGTFAGINAGSGAPDKLDADEFATWEANVRLIGAAPDLLTELQDAASHCEACDGKGIAYTHPDETEVGCTPGSSRIDCPMCTRWRIAIEKAVGG